jgi:hypothetical protein
MTITETLALALGSGALPLPPGWSMLLVGGHGPNYRQADKLADPCGTEYGVGELLDLGIVGLQFDNSEVEARAHRPMFGLKSGGGYDR